MVYIFCVKADIHTNKDNCDRKSSEKNDKVRILYDCMKNVIVRSWICMARLRKRAQFVGLGVRHVHSTYMLGVSFGSKSVKSDYLKAA